ncbi:NOM1 [Mytilus coruscus]|uniref:NOM1 n=1 Tax=Mytilus coruscus TaxID=42192 RepID=A0A6J8BUE6_MYTCO|nr:NOM1 [Mytilus coruscus]
MPKVEDQLKKKKEEEKIERKQKKLEKLKKKKKKSKEKKKEKLKMEEEMKKEDMLAAIQREEKMLKQLSKQLHLNKRKSKTLPQSFLNDGLDYLLDVVDKDKVSALYEDSDIEDEATSGNIDESNSDQEVSDEMDDEKSDDIEDDQQKKKAIDEIMSHLKKSEAKSILKTSKTVKKDKTLSNVKFYQDKEEGEADVDDDFSDEDENLDDVDDNLSNDDNLDIENLSDDDKDVDEDEEDENLDVRNLSEDDEEDLHNHDHDESEDEKILNRKLKHSQEETVGNESDDVLSEGNSDIEAVTKLHHKKGDKPESKLKEDIYGRLRDSEGNVVTMATASYIPPAKRLAMADTMDEKKKLKMERLKKQLKGLINRTSEANMGPIISQIETIYTTNSRGDVNESLRDIIMESTVSSIVTPERLAMELMMLVAILNNNVGMEVGGLFIQQLAWKLKASWEDLEGKYLDNIVLLFSHLYNFKVVHCILIFDIIRKFVERFTEKDIELILLVLRSVGFSLRKDDPHTLKDIILLIQGKASSLDKTESSRVQFMLDVLLAIKNNNMRKIPNYDPEKCEQMKKSARNHVKTSLGTNQLRIGLEDLMNAEDKGRWWVVGSAWEGRSDKHEDVRQTVQTTILGEASDKILELARKQRMNTGIRKSIFCSIMTSETNNSPENTAQTNNSPENTAQTSNSPENTAQTNNSPENTAQTSNSPENTAQTNNSPENTAQTSNSPENTAQTSNSPENTAQTNNSPENTAQTNNSPENTAQTNNSPENTAQTNNSPENTAQTNNSPENTAQTSNSPENTAQTNNSPENTAQTIVQKTLHRQTIVQKTLHKQAIVQKTLHRQAIVQKTLHKQ